MSTSRKRSSNFTIPKKKRTTTKDTDHVHTQPGEKGAGRTLLTLAHINQDKPNAVDSTDIIIAYDGDEKTSNLQIVSTFKRFDNVKLEAPEEG